MPNHLTSARAVIDTLDGIANVAALTGRSYNAVANWVGSSFPPNTYLVLTAALAERGYTAPAKLWSMIEPNEQ